MLVTLDMPGKVADFLRATELEAAELAALAQGVVVRRGQGYTLRVTAVPTVRCRLLALCQPLDGGQGVPTVPAQGKARREYENRISTLVPTESCSFSPGPPYVNYSHPEENPRQLGRDHLDVVNLRIVGIDSIAERFGALAELRAAGLIRHLGLSNVRPHHLAEARTIAPVVCVQNMYGMGASPEQKKFLRNCGEQRIAFVPFCSIAGPGREGGATADDSREVRAIARPPRSQRGPGTAGVGPAPGAPRPGHPRYRRPRPSRPERGRRCSALVRGRTRCPGRTPPRERLSETPRDADPLLLIGGCARYAVRTWWGRFAEVAGPGRPPATSTGRGPSAGARPPPAARRRFGVPRKNRRLPSSHESAHLRHPPALERFHRRRHPLLLP